MTEKETYQKLPKSNESVEKEKENICKVCGNDFQIYGNQDTKICDDCNIKEKEILTYREIKDDCEKLIISGMVNLAGQSQEDFIQSVLDKEFILRSQGKTNSEILKSSVEFCKFLGKDERRIVETFVKQLGVK